MRAWPILAILVLGVGCSEDPPEPPRPRATVAQATTIATTTPAVAPEGSDRRPFPIGRDVVIDGGWSLEVSRSASILRDTVQGRPSKPSAALVVAVDLEMSFLGPGGGFAMEALDDLRAVGPSRRLYPYYRGHCADDDLLWQLESILTGGRVAGQVCFIVDSSDADELVMFLDASPDRDDRTFFSLR